MKLFLVIGTRPEIIKMSPIVHECEKRGIDFYLLHTGQHYSSDMSDSFFDDLGMRLPDRNLDIGSGTHSEQTAKGLVGIERELIEQKPSVVVAVGDTNAVLAAALAAAKLRTPFAHVEAGLRSYDRRMPEEHNRRLADHVSDFLFAPTEASAEILRKESVWGEIFVTGNTVIDALENRLPFAKEKHEILSKYEVKDFALLTLHRAENVDDKEILEGIVTGLISLEKEILFPAHPRTIARLKEFGLNRIIESSDAIRVIDPIGYLEFLSLLKACRYILTDSGGIQEEATAPSINKQVFVLRISTERPEAVESGHASVVGIDPTIFPKLVSKQSSKPLVGRRSCPFGDGDAANKIIDILLEKLT
ncbi:MAG: non-hydrolyzing UDP-N-acetylglucosamine 2-epimerase [Candidatus Thorarchaeota archaeon]|jgi:UDP-N-acetylglucosamine 2-epimerase (non-hydrolysing)